MLLCVIHVYVHKNLLKLLGGLNYFICIVIEQLVSSYYIIPLDWLPLGQAQQPARI